VGGGEAVRPLPIPIKPKMNIAEIQKWANENSGLIALIAFLVPALTGVAIWFIRDLLVRKSKKPELTISVIEEPTMCSSFDIGGSFHRTAFLLYLKIQNDGETTVQIGDIHVGYRSETNENVNHWRWLKNETVLLEDYATPMGDNKKVYPFLKQKNQLIDNEIHTLLVPGENVNGLVYFEQEKSEGKDFPYMEPDYKVQTLIVVHDTKGNKWSVEHRVLKVKIEPIREICPSFGLTRGFSENH